MQRLTVGGELIHLDPGLGGGAAVGGREVLQGGDPSRIGFGDPPVSVGSSAGQRSVDRVGIGEDLDSGFDPVDLSGERRPAAAAI